MNFFNRLPQYGVYVLGLNLLLCGISEGFMGFEGMEEMFPLLMLGGMGGGQSNYVPQRPIMPPLLPPTLPPTPSPPVYKPPQTITWRWVPNMRYTWPLGNNNMQWPQYNPYIMPLANNAMGKAGSAFNTNTISGVKSSAGNNMPIPAVPGAMMGNPGAMLGNPGAMMGNAGAMMNGGGPVPPAGGMINGMGLAGSNMAATKQMTWNTQSQTTSKGPTAM